MKVRRRFHCVGVGGNRFGQSIQRTDGSAHRQVRHVQIPGGGLEVAVSQQDLDAAQVDRVFQQMSGEGMPQRMR